MFFSNIIKWQSLNSFSLLHVALQKLRLCHPQTGEAFRMDDTLLSLLAHPDTPLYNGGNVILEYLDNESTGLNDVSDYVTVT